MTFLTFVLHTGGTGALSRMVEGGDAEAASLLEAEESWQIHPVETAAAVKERLALASGLPADTLISRWQNALMEERDRLGDQAGSLMSGPARRTGWAAVFWFLVLALTASRSTRWRLG